MECDASITPLSTSFKDDSTILATKGAAATTNGTIVAVEPIVVPTIARVNGRMATNRIINGTERKKFIIKPRTLFKTGIRKTPFSSVTQSNTPRGKPKT
jgi:hypothetical protein